MINYIISLRLREKFPDKTETNSKSITIVLPEKTNIMGTSVVF